MMLEYKLIGEPRRYKNGHGKRAKNYSQRFSLPHDPPRKVRSVSLGTSDKAVARQRASRYVELRVRNISMAFDPQFRTLHSDVHAALREYASAQLAVGNTEKQVTLVTTRISAIIAEAGIREYRELDSVRVVQAIRALLDKKKFKTIATANKYVEAARAWTRWMMFNGRWNCDPLAKLQKLRGDTSNSRPRAILSQRQLEQLIRITKSQPSRRNLTGEQRSWLYLTAAVTGLRAHELHSLAPINFNLDHSPAYVEISNTISKRGKRTGKKDRIELQNSFRDMLQIWLADKPKHEAIWGSSESWWYKAARMLRDDLDAAGLPSVVQTREGVGIIDFHSLRGLFVTNAIRTGQPSRVVMRVARLSSELLLERYAKISEAEVTACIEAMPSPSVITPSSSSDRQRAAS